MKKTIIATVVILKYDCSFNPLLIFLFTFNLKLLINIFYRRIILS